MFWICISLLEIAYTVALLVGASSGFLWSKVATVMFEIPFTQVYWHWYDIPLFSTCFNSERPNNVLSTDNVDLLSVLPWLGIGTHNFGFNTLESCQVCWSEQQSCNNILLHVYMEGNHLIWFIGDLQNSYVWCNV